MKAPCHTSNRVQPHLLRRLIFPVAILLVCLITSSSAATTKKARTIPTQRPYVIDNRSYYPLPSAEGFEETGTASWYGNDFHGKPTSNGETYNMHGITAAHKLLPMHTMLLVTNLDNGRQLVVRVNDRGPFIRGRIIDLSYGAAEKLDLLETGTAKVKITALGEVQKANGHHSFKHHADLQSGEYFVQIGAFTQKYNSLNLQGRFLDAGHYTVIKKALIKGKTFYRVQVYVGQTLRGARKGELALLDKGYKGAFIIAR